MKTLFRIVLYTALAFGANAGLADVETAKALRDGDMKKLVFHEVPKDVTQTGFETIDGNSGTLADYQGKVVVLNFWATWCAPCRKEMPMLSDLQAALGGEAFEVVTIATGRNPPQAMKSFFHEIGVTNLPLHRDPRSKMAREMGVLGLPVTMVLDENGKELARLVGDAHWSSDTAKAMIRALIDADPSG
ncbi:MAG: TlpA disulfide reductase family protein [Pseudomonadota bacterium]